jgi:hypothetical protein
MQRLSAFSPLMRASRGLAVDGDHVRIGVLQGRDPGGEARLEQLGIERIDEVVQRVVAGDAVLVAQERAQEGQMLIAPLLDLDEIIGASQRCSQCQKQKLGQRIDHLPRLPRVFQRRKMLEQCDLLRSQGHASLPSDSEALYESHRIRLWESRNPQSRAIALKRHLRHLAGHCQREHSAIGVAVDRSRVRAERCR